MIIKKILKLNNLKAYLNAVITTENLKTMGLDEHQGCLSPGWKIFLCPFSCPFFSSPIFFGFSRIFWDFLYFFKSFSYLKIQKKIEVIRSDGDLIKSTDRMVHNEVKGQPG